MMKKIVVLTGAGISAESGISTFRDANGLWENHDVMDVATPEGWRRNPRLVLEFYNQRRRQLKTVEPNEAHRYLKRLEEEYDVTIITQNVDNLHERAGSSHVIHLHGELNKVRSVKNEQLVYDWNEDLVLGDTGVDGAQLRPHIVWFGEMVPMLEKAAAETLTADMMLIIGTSLQVYPAASLVDYVAVGTPIYVIDPHEVAIPRNPYIHLIPKRATEGVIDFDRSLRGG
ncbi:SIR2 family NAD-dependent protein deacylase [Sphingobacterium sp. SGR-19]|uniref:SIR2 family NAD-dependent protein deacylase n=1 Tax=Sphingobacterium sp. SGR-19 TaxID=2710886 RepID=UPI0013EB592F|nr:NAD-dependent deacylase [Sphingobacterium sp. SGR-19]NGM64358.1 NAD-dependent deacylase [Sphingobacterium sp. SGR-19]